MNKIILILAIFLLAGCGKADKPQKEVGARERCAQSGMDFQILYDNSGNPTGVVCVSE